MKREDVRDKALGALLFKAADYAAREGARLPRTAECGRDRVRLFRTKRFALAAAVAAAALLAVGLGLPTLSRMSRARALVRSSVDDFSRNLMPEHAPLLAELPVRSGVEAAAVGFSEYLWTVDGEL